MSYLLFIFLLFFFYFFQILISILAILLSHFIPKVKKRLAFERRNLISDSSRSFKKDALEAHCCFEVSSEGELEQVYPLIQDFLLRHKLVEIVYSSESVEKKCQLLFEKHPQQIRLFRMPLLTGNFFSFLFFQNVGSWVSAEKIVFCRYDFFPTLLILKFWGHHLYLVSGCVKKVSWFKRHVFSLFEYVIAANETEQLLFINDIGLSEQKVSACDFRIPRICKRVEERDKVFESRPHLHHLISYFKEKNSQDKLIMGSLWPSDAQIFLNEEFKKDLRDNNLSILILPHKLEAVSLKELSKTISTVLNDPSIPLRIVNVLDKDFEPEVKNYSGITILVETGILVEFYALFDVAYVGGGFERSIHSLLEPYFAHAMAICGAKTHRSTEYDFIVHHSPDEIQVLKNPESFYNSYSKGKNQILSYEKRFNLRLPFYKDSLKNMEHFIQILEKKAH